MADNSDAAAITDAYSSELKDLYKVLLQGVVSGVERDATQRFAAGVKAARRARDLALQALVDAGAPAPAKP